MTEGIYDHDPVPLLTPLRMAWMLGVTLASVERLLSRSPAIRPEAYADHIPIYDRRGWAELQSRVEIEAEYRAALLAHARDRKSKKEET